MITQCFKMSTASWFQRLILGLILLNAILIGLETSTSFMQSYELQARALNIVFQFLFCVEILVRVIGNSNRLGHFFRDGWNLFDIAVVSLSLIPSVGPFATIARLARLLRVLRLVSVLPELKLIIGTMLKSIPSLGHVTILLGLILYVYAVLGVHLFRESDPEHWGSLGTAFLTLFQIITLEGWTEIQKVSMQTYPWAWLYYVSFVVTAVFVVINLFIAVVLNNLETARSEIRAENQSQNSIEKSLQSIREEIEKIEQKISKP
jgi:voltage-gated sodium channel